VFTLSSQHAALTFQSERFKHIQYYAFLMILIIKESYSKYNLPVSVYKRERETVFSAWHASRF